MTERKEHSELPSVSGSGSVEEPGQSQDMPRIEGYEVTGRLGEGGMGVVWKAVQLGTRRPVALKLLAAGAFASETARIRFEREVQLSARLQHPNIARVYDSGLYQGVYYYAMELVEGLRLDDYAKERRLTRKQILQLMRGVSQAVQHAHQKGVIHRDLKPSNILVTEDGQPHVLDFGLAKDLLAEGERGGVTVTGEVAGTVAYMSPEQAAGKTDQIDTRSDVYSLGVILYRLVTGSAPHDLSGTSYEVLHRISEEEVARPRKVARDIDRELESLLLKALSHDPEKRYSTAGELAQDIGNYLTGEPLTARKPTATYFLGKRIRKHWVPLAIASVILAGLLGMWGFSHLRITRAEEEARLYADYLIDTVLAGGLKRETADRVVKVAGETFAKYPVIESDVRNKVGLNYKALGNYKEAEEQFRLALELRTRVLGAEHEKTLSSMNNLAATFRAQGKYPDAEKLHRQTLEIRRRVLGKDHPDTLSSMNNLANALSAEDKYAEAERLLREVLPSMRHVLGKTHEDTLSAMNNLVAVLGAQRKYPEASKLAGETIELMKKAFGQNHPSTLGARHNLACLLYAQGEHADAERLHRDVLAARKVALGVEHPDTLTSTKNLARVLVTEGENAEAEKMLLEAIPVMKRILGKDDAGTLNAIGSLGMAYIRQSKNAEAEKLLREVIPDMERVLGNSSPATLNALKCLIAALEALGKKGEADELRRTLPARPDTNAVDPMRT